jgi:hypothetical protein
VQPVVLANPEVADKLRVAFLPAIPLFASVAGAGGGFPGLLSLTRISHEEVAKGLVSWHNWFI